MILEDYKYIRLYFSILLITLHRLRIVHALNNL